MNQRLIWGRFMKKTRGRQSRATVPLMSICALGHLHYLLCLVDIAEDPSSSYGFPVKLSAPSGSPSDIPAASVITVHTVCKLTGRLILQVCSVLCWTGSDPCHFSCWPPQGHHYQILKTCPLATACISYPTIICSSAFQGSLCLLPLRPNLLPSVAG